LSTGGEGSRESGGKRKKNRLLSHGATLGVPI
jgi:hypothetical protein